MLILLPPSEGKSAAESGPALDLATLAFPDLNDTRNQVLDALVKLCSGTGDKAARVLGLGPTQHGEVGANTLVRSEPCAPSIEVYTGVLYEALDASSLSPAARRRLNEHVAIASAAFGLVRPSDPIPAYRLSGGVTLPKLGPLAGVWREGITATIEDQDGLVIDMRSGAYVALGPLPDSLADRAVTVRVLTERAGKRSVVSHHNKSTKGHLTRALALSRRSVRDTDGLMDVLDSAGYRVELNEPTKGSIPLLDVVLTD